MSAAQPGILMVTGAYWPELSGGGLQCRTMIQALRDRFRFRVFTTCTDPTLPRHDVVDGIVVTRTYVDVHRPMTKVSAAAAAAMFFLRNHATFDVVHLHGFSQKSVLLVMLARLFRKKVIITIHTAGQDEPDAIRRFGALAYRCYAGADRFIAISDLVADNFKRSGLPLQRLTVAPNAVDTGRFSPLSQSTRADLRRTLGHAPQDVPWVLFVGFFSAEKRPELLFDAWLRLQATGTQSALIFVGATESAYHEVDASIAHRIQTAAERAGLRSSVHFAGEVRDIERYFQTCDVFVMPSTREAFGMVLVEAMACGRPSVATRIAGVTDMIVDDGRTGILVPADDSEALSGAIARLLHDSEGAARIGTAARASVIERFGLAASVERWNRVYESVL